MKFGFMGAVAVVGLAYFAWSFLLAPLRGEAMGLRQKADQQETLLAKRRGLMLRKEAIEADYVAARKSFRAILESRIPPASNVVAWAQAVISQVPVNLRLTNIRDGGVRGTPVASGKRGEGGKPPLFEEVLVNCETEGTFLELGKFLAAFEDLNPLARVAAVEVAAADPGTGRSKIQFTVAFLRYNALCLRPEELPTAERPEVRKTVAAGAASTPAKATKGRAK
ncbi:MAG: hypothetical protein WC789_09760 [Lentisphaeria bacterium]